VETFLHASGIRTVTTAALKNRALSQLKPHRALRLIDLAGSGALVRMGVDSRLFAGEYQPWSKALHDHPAKADGLCIPIVLTQPDALSRYFSTDPPSSRN
jgi:hypothetical protein